MKLRLGVGIAVVGSALAAAPLACSDPELITRNDAGAGANGSAGSGVGAGIGIGGGGNGTGATVDDGGLGDGDVCASTKVGATITPAVLFFLVDRTGSMNCNVPPIQTSEDCEGNPQKVDPAQPSKWEITRDAFSTALSGLETAVPLPTVGIAFFNNDNYCGFPVAPEVDLLELSGDAATDPQLAALQAGLAAVVPKGSTPIVGSVMGAYSFLHQNKAMFPGNRFVVLLTDGAETCDAASTDFLVQKSLEASWVGIRTFVLGAPGSEPARALLSQLAFNGGTATNPNCDHSGAQPDVGDCHMDMTLPNTDFAAELQANLATISAQVLSCVVDVPQPGPNDPPVDLGKVNVVYTGGDGKEQTVLQDNSVPCSDPSNKGWQYTDNNTKIELCGAACEMLKSDPKASLSIELGCETQEVPK